MGFWRHLSTCQKQCSVLKNVASLRLVHKSGSSLLVIEARVIPVTETHHFTTQEVAHFTHGTAVVQICRPTGLENVLACVGPVRLDVGSDALAKDLVDKVLFTLERRIGSLQGQHLPQDHRHGVDVAAVIVAEAQTNFGGHVAQGSRHVREVVGAIRGSVDIVQLAGHAKVKNLDVTALWKDQYEKRTS